MINALEPTELVKNKHIDAEQPLTGSHTHTFPPGGSKPLAGNRMKHLHPPLPVYVSVFSLGDRVVGSDLRERCPNREKHKNTQGASFHLPLVFSFLILLETPSLLCCSLTGFFFYTKQ